MMQAAMGTDCLQNDHPLRRYYSREPRMLRARHHLRPTPMDGGDVTSSLLRWSHDTSRGLCRCRRKAPVRMRSGGRRLSDVYVGSPGGTILAIRMSRLGVELE